MRIAIATAREFMSIIMVNENIQFDVQVFQNTSEITKISNKLLKQAFNHRSMFI